MKNILLYLKMNLLFYLFYLLFPLLPLIDCARYTIINDDTHNNTDLEEYILLDQSTTTSSSLLHHPCRRECVAHSPALTCRYNFTVEWYSTLSKACYACPDVEADCARPDCVPGDGHRRAVVVVNRQMPGPAIEVCLGDEIIVDVQNMLLGETTSIHWHGHHQRGTPYMDGVPFVTQCPIQAGSTFRYHFRATNIGTHFWHSHTGLQRADGAFGSFTVRIPKSTDPHQSLYDYDLSSHTMIILDWGREIGLNKFVAHHHSSGDNKPTTLLVNGLGLIGGAKNEFNNTVPPARFKVQKGFRYRFRIINAEFLNCPIEVSVDNHTMTVISTDGNDFKPVEAESIVTYAGERFDFILNANQEIDVYWMRFRGLMDCDERFKSAHQVAVLEYKDSKMSDDEEYPEGDPDYESSHKDGLQMNALNKGTGHNNSIGMPELKSLDEWDKSLQKEADFKYFISYDFYRIDNPHYHQENLYGFNNVTDKKQQLLTPQLNHISLKLPSFPLLSGRRHLQPEMLCNETTVKGCETKYCECSHVVHIALGSVVELILIDKGFAFDANHPFHLHGHAFRVVGMERLGSNVTVEKVLELDKKGLLKRNLKDAVVKDTVTVPDGGYTIIRFVASNPGYWLFHCHIEFHIELGMALVFKFGEDTEMPPVPSGFPQCGNYLPELTLPTNESLFSQFWHHLINPSPSKGNSLLPSSMATAMPFCISVILLTNFLVSYCISK